jgi:hypothetical protein
MHLFHPWMRHLLLALGVIFLIGFGLFSWFAWVSPQAREGNRNLRAAHLVKPGMSVPQALTIMGPPASKRTNPVGVFYVYTKHPFSSDDVTFWVSADSVVAGVGYGD